MFPFNSKIKYLITVLFLLGILIFVGITIFQEYQKHLDIAGLDDNLKLQTPPGSIVLATEYASEPDGSAEISSEPIIVYTYITDQPAPAETYEDLKEDIEKRTPTSQQFVVYKNDKEEKYVGKFYTAMHFARQGDKWYEVKRATTTKNAFLKQVKPTPLIRMGEFFGQMVFAADTIYSGAGDGHVYKDDSVSWATTHDAAAGTTATASAITAILRSSCTIFDSICRIYRLFLPFDTSAIPSDAVLVGASLNIYVTDTTDVDNDGSDLIYTVQTFQADSTTLGTGDYEDCGSDNGTAGRAKYIPEVGDDEGNDITNITSNAYLEITLNPTGVGWIKKSGEISSCGVTAGYTCLGIREGHDIINVEIGHGTIFGDSVTISTSENSGTSQDPYLLVTYSMSPPSLKLNSGKLKLNGGYIKVNSN